MSTKENPFSLEGKVGLITGGSRGLGLAYARSLAAAGADLAILSRKEDELREAERLITGETGRRVAVFQGDVASLDQVDRVVDSALDVFPGIDILINNAGANCRKPFLEITPEEFDRVADVNFKAVYFLTQKVARHMVERGKGGQDHQHRLIDQHSRHPECLRLRGNERSGLCADQGPGRGAGALRHPGQRHRAGVLPDELHGSGLSRPGTCEMDEFQDSPWTDRKAGRHRQPGRLSRIAGIRLHDRDGHLRGRGMDRRVSLTGSSAPRMKLRRHGGTRICFK